MLLLAKPWIKLQEFCVDHIDPDGIQPLQALRTAIAGIIAIIFYRAINWSQAYWILLSTILILQTYLGNTPKMRFTYLICTGVMASWCAYIASFCGMHLWTLALFLTLTTFISLYGYVISTNVGNAAFYINLFCLSSGALAVDATNSWQRAVSILLGATIAAVVCLCCWPERLNQQIRQIIAGNLKRLSAFNYTLINRTQHEKAIVIRRNRMMRGLQRAHQIIPPNEIQDHQFIRKIEYLYEVIFSFYQLKCYVTEKNVLRLIEKELPIISRRISWLLDGAARCVLQQRKIPDSEKFVRTLRTFEKLYERHLPRFNQEQFLAFTIYIDNIHKLEKIVIDLLELLKKKYHAT